MAIFNEERFPQDQNLNQGVGHVSALSQWLLLAVLALILAVVVSVGYVVHQRENTRKLAETNNQLQAEISGMREQLASLTAKLNEISKPVVPAPLAPVDEAWGVHPTQTNRPSRHRSASLTDPPALPKWGKAIQQQLARQSKLLASTQQDLARTRADLENNLDSTRSTVNDLSGSIARNHAELVALEQLGERNYYEFDLYKSKRFQREGPISLSLRHTDTKHRHYDVVLLIDDYQLTKKHVNLYEPVRFMTAKGQQATELVVNQIDKNHVHGYVSVPKSLTPRTAEITPSSSMQDSDVSAPSAQPQTSDAKPAEVSLTRRPQSQP
jgi:hypothetical protein